MYVLHTRMMDFILRYPLFFQYSKLIKQQDKALRVLHGFTDDVIRKRRKELLAMKSNNNDSISQEEEDDKSMGIPKKCALLDTLLNSTVDGKPSNDLEIREEVDTFMFEVRLNGRLIFIVAFAFNWILYLQGHNTTTSGITFCLYNIAKNPDVQEKCFKEIVEVFGTNPKEPATLAKLNQLSYLELAIKETLRMFRPSHWLAAWSRRTSNYYFWYKHTSNCTIQTQVQRHHRMLKPLNRTGNNQTISYQMPIKWQRPISTTLLK